MNEFRIVTASDDDIAAFASQRTRDNASQQAYIAAAMHATHRMCVADQDGVCGVLLAHESGSKLEIIDVFIAHRARERGAAQLLLHAVLAPDTLWQASCGMDAAACALLARNGATHISVVHLIAGEIPKDENLLAQIGIEGEYAGAPLKATQRHLVHDMERMASGRETAWLYDLRDEWGTAVTLWRENDVVGYAYFDASGQIGPARVTSPAYMAALLAYSLHALRNTSGASWARLCLPASNVRGLNFVLDCGMRLDRSFLRVSNCAQSELATYVGFLPFAF